MPAMKAYHTTDPRDELLASVGDISQLELFSNAILVAQYIRPNTIKLKGGQTFHLADKTTEEDRYQGKVGLVIAKGPLAFVDDETTKFHGQNVEIGDWVAYRASDGWQVTLTDNKVLCRLLIEADIRARIPSPDYVW